MNDYNLVTVEEFIKQVWEVEHVKIKVNRNSEVDRLVRPYNFERLSDQATVDDLKERLKYCLSQFMYIIEEENHE